MEPALFDVVELRIASGEWPAGTTGTIVERFRQGAVVEIVDSDGRTRDLLEVPYDVLAVVPRDHQERLAV